MKSLCLAFIAISLSSGISYAACYRVGNFVSCDDGTSYSTFGGTTYGSNSNTGNTWSQTQMGNSTYGTDSDGNTWSAQRFGNTTYYTDSDGSTKTCTNNNGQTTCY